MCQLIYIAFILFININLAKFNYIGDLDKQMTDSNENKKYLFKRNRQFNLLTDEILKKVPVNNQKGKFIKY
jgi:hypothetical protein